MYVWGGRCRAGACICPWEANLWNTRTTVCKPVVHAYHKLDTFWILWNARTTGTIVYPGNQTSSDYRN